MFSMHDRIRSALLGLTNVYVHGMGNEEGFFYQLPDRPGILFATLSDTEIACGEVRYRFNPHGFALAEQPKSWQAVRGWPGWVQALNPCCEEEETVWLGILASYRYAIQSKQAAQTKAETAVHSARAQTRAPSGGQHAVL